jgi:hypothetical protein
VDERENRGHEEQGRSCREAQTTDDGTTERRVLLATLAQAQSHRHHADDHGERRHQHRAEAGEAGLECRRQGIDALFAHAIAREAHHQDAVGGGDADGHDGAGERRNTDRRLRQEEHPDDAGQGRRQRRDDDESVDPGLEVDDDQQVDQQDSESEAAEEADERGPHRLD